MPITIFQGDTGRPFRFPLSYSDNTKPNLSGFNNSNFQLHLYNGTTTIVANGSWQVLDGVSGTVSYQPLSSEVATPGSWQVYLTVIFPSGPVTWMPDSIIITATH